jgi:hypothetical protein
MASSLSYQFKAAIGGGPSFSAQSQLDTESYSLTQVAIPITAGGVGTTVAIGAGAATEIQMLCISVDNYRNAAGALAISVTTAALGTPLMLDGPLVLMGAGAAALLGTPIDSLDFNNGTGAERTVTILVARNA